MQNVINIREIELIPSAEGVKIFDYDVLTREEDKRVRRVALDKAATLSKVSGRKANIVLKTPAGYKRIQTLVQATWVATCRECHSWCHLNPAEARILGYLK